MIKSYELLHKIVDIYTWQQKPFLVFGKEFKLFGKTCVY